LRSAPLGFGLLLALGVCGGVASARESRAAAEPAPGPEVSRTRVIVRLDSELAEEEERALSTLLNAELAASGVSASLERSAAPLPAWIDEARANRDVLLVVALDAREQKALELYVIDAARGRAIVRRLPGGLDSNAALIEAIVSIVASAAAALREGLELASQPLSEVVPPATDAPPAEASPKAPASARPARASANSMSFATAGPVDSAASESARRPASPRFGAGLGGAVSSFLEDHAPSFGVVPSLVARPTRALGVHAEAAFFWPSELVTSAGEFSLGRTRFDLTASYTQDLAAFSVEPELGVALELLQREVTRAAPAVASTDDATFVRVGPLGRLRLRYALSRLLGLELAGNLAYFPREIRFVAEGATTQELAVPLHFSAGAELGLYILSWKE
jgi:hypothetical protein